jgi:hypothetical protein
VRSSEEGLPALDQQARLTAARASRPLALANWAAAAALFALLFWNRSENPAVLGRYSAPYAAMLLACAAAFAGITAITWRGSLPKRPALERVPVRLGLALLPWALLGALTLAMPLLWSQRPWQLRLFVCFLAADWSILWLFPRPSADRSSSRQALCAAGAVLILAALQGLAFGTTAFGFAVSSAAAAGGVLACAAGLLAPRDRRVAVLTVLVSSAIALAIGEAILRAFDVGASLTARDDPAIVRRFHHNAPPHTTVVRRPHPLDEYPPVLFETNSLGIRGPEIAGNRTDLLIVGDSFVQAAQIPWDRTLGPQLEAELRGRGIRATAVSHGVVSWSPLLEWNWYLKVGRALRPRVVFLFFFWNDLPTEVDEATTYRAVLDADGRPDHFDIDIGSSWLWHRQVRSLELIEAMVDRAETIGVRRAFQGARAASARPATLAEAQRAALGMTESDLLTPADVARLATAREEELSPELRALSRTKFWPSLRPIGRWSPRQVELAGRSERILGAFARDVQADRAQFVIVYVPNPLQLGPGECAIGRYFDRVGNDVMLDASSGVQAWLAGVSRRQGIALIDPTQAMRAHVEREGSTAPLYLRYDCHWTEAGHAFVAQLLAEWYARESAG